MVHCIPRVLLIAFVCWLPRGAPCYRLESLRLFSEKGIPTMLIQDSAVAAFMEEVDMCLVGAEGVMENGGIVNKVRHHLRLCMLPSLPCWHTNSLRCCCCYWCC